MKYAAILFLAAFALLALPAAMAVYAERMGDK